MWQVLCAVPDPEIPIVSIVDLGIVRYVHWQESGPRIGLTPTYVGCPATDAIRTAVQQALVGAGYADAVIEEVLSPPWTSDWLTTRRARKARRLRHRSPGPGRARSARAFVRRTLPALRESIRLACSVEFGSTPCKAHYRCEACLEPFNRFKCI